VQHLSKNGCSPRLPSSSFVACIEVIGNCDVATEGGIPRSWWWLTQSHLRYEDALIFNVFSRAVFSALYAALYRLNLEVNK
jgi:hypothetical protein